MVEGIIGTCEDCDYYEECGSEECPKDKDPHGRCYVQPPEWMIAPVKDSAPSLEDWEIVYRREPPEVFADRTGCRFWRK